MFHKALIAKRLHRDMPNAAFNIKMLTATAGRALPEKRTWRLSAIAAYCFFEKKPVIDELHINDRQQPCLDLYRTHERC